MPRRLSNDAYIIEKIRDGSTYSKGTRIVFNGAKSTKPKGWKIIKKIS